MMLQGTVLYISVPKTSATCQTQCVCWRRRGVHSAIISQDEAVGSHGCVPTDKGSPLKEPAHHTHTHKASAPRPVSYLPAKDGAACYWPSRMCPVKLT